MLQREEIVGRAAELADIRSFLAVVPTGFRALLIGGEAGVGKTTVWNWGVTEARKSSFRVLACRASQTEAQLAFTVLGDLLDLVVQEGLPELPSPQRHGLEVALLRDDPGPDPLEPRTVGLAVLGVLRNLAQQGPVVLAVDDLQWVDASSARVLDFAMRRLDMEPIGVIASARIPDSPTRSIGAIGIGPEARRRTIFLEHLDLGAIQRVVHGRFSETLSGSAVRRIHQVSAGNPFYALEIARALVARGIDPAPGEPLPVPETLDELLGERMAALASSSRRALLLASLMTDPTVANLSTAMEAESGRARDGISRGVREGAIVVEEGRIRFTHPLLASAVSSRATPEQRRRAHQLLSRVVEDVEEQARHLALGAEGPDEGTARTVALAAERTDARGAPEAAADLYALAARLTPDERAEERAGRKLRAASSAHRAGDLASARRLLDEIVAEFSTGPIRARALLALGVVAWETDSSMEAVRLREEALRHAGHDEALRADIHGAIAEDSDFDARLRARHARAALEAMERVPGPNPGALAGALMAYAESEISMGRRIPMDVVARAIELERPAPPARVWHRAEVILGWWRVYWDDLDSARATLERAMETAVSEGDENSMMHLERYLSQVELNAGWWDKALGHATRVLESVEAMGSVLWKGVALARKSLIEAHLGQIQVARVEAEEGLRIAEESGDQGLIALCLWSPGFLDLSLGDLPAVDRWLSKADSIVESMGLREPMNVRFHADHIEALIAMGQLDRAEGLLIRMEKRGRMAQRPWTLATAERSWALLLAARGDLEAAMGRLERALERHSGLPMPFELGRTLLVGGQVLRRARRRGDARRKLNRAIGIFAELPAPLWEQRARAELGRIGGRVASRWDLTSSERRVADLVAGGRSNREVADELFVSVNTVETHLRNAFRKLGVRSRTELAAAIHQGDRP